MIDDTGPAWQAWKQACALAAQAHRAHDLAEEKARQLRQAAFEEIGEPKVGTLLDEIDREKNPPIVSPLTDADLAAHIRIAAASFNQAVDTAHAAGISVSFSISRWIRSPSKSHVTDIRIERDANWEEDYGGETL